MVLWVRAVHVHPSALFQVRRGVACDLCPRSWFNGYTHVHTSESICIQLNRIGASRSLYEPRCGHDCLVVRSFKSVVVSRVTCAQDSGSIGKHMCIHLNQAYSNPPAKRFLLGAMSAACRGGYVVFCTILNDFWTGFENPRFRDMSLSRLFHLSNLSDTQILLQALQSKPKHLRRFFLKTLLCQSGLRT